MEVARACYKDRPRKHCTNCIKVDTGKWKKKERSSTRNLEKDDRDRNEKNKGRLGKNVRQQPRIGSNGNPWYQPFLPLRREESRVMSDMSPESNGNKNYHRIKGINK